MRALLRAVIAAVIRFCAPVLRPVLARIVRWREKR